MDYHPLKDRLNDFLLQHIGEDRPAYLDIDATYPELNDLTAHFDVIRDEWDAFEERRGKSDHDGLTLVQNGRVNAVNRTIFPLTCRLLDDVPDVVQASFSVLEPRTSVPCHRGPSLGFLRYELGIKVPRRNPPTLVVDKQPYKGREGEAVMFDASHPHMVINRSDELRVVLTVDVLRALPWHLSALNKAMIFGLAKSTAHRKVVSRVGGTGGAPTH